MRTILKPAKEIHALVSSIFSWKISQDILPPPDFHNSAICRNSSAIFSARKCGGAQFEKCLLCILHNFAPFLRPIWLEAEIRKAAIMIVPLFSPHSLFYPITCKKSPFALMPFVFLHFLCNFFRSRKYACANSYVFFMSGWMKVDFCTWAEVWRGF